MKSHGAASERPGEGPVLVSSSSFLDPCADKSVLWRRISIGAVVQGEGGRWLCGGLMGWSADVYREDMPRTCLRLNVENGPRSVPQILSKHA